MTKRLARTLSLSFAPALVALACLSLGRASALEPQDTPATAAVAPSAKAHADKTTGHAAKSGHTGKAHKHAKHHKKHAKTK